MIVVGTGAALIGGLLLPPGWAAIRVPIGDGLVVVDGWILRADEAAAVFT